MSKIQNPVEENNLCVPRCFPWSADVQSDDKTFTYTWAPQWKISVTSSTPSVSLSLHTWAKHALGRKWACCCLFPSFIYYNLNVALSSPPESKGGWRKEKERTNNKHFFLAPFWAIRRNSVISLPSIMESPGWVVLMKKGMLTSRVYLKREGPRASRFRTFQFRISQISDTWLRTGPRWELTPWPGRAGIKEITLLSKTTDVAGSGGVCL